jgi:pimeloyl-ACP methyl ester carboxylesterase
MTTEGHGRSSQPWNGNDMDTYADDLAKLVETLNLQNAIHVGHSTGGGEVARIHGDDDQIVPIGASALLSSKIIQGATLKVYRGGPHGICSTHKHEVNADLLAFLKS